MTNDYDGMIGGDIDCDNKPSKHPANNKLVGSNAVAATGKAEKNLVSFIWKKPKDEWLEESKRLREQVSHVLKHTATDADEHIAMWQLEGRIPDSLVDCWEQWGFVIERGKGDYGFNPKNGKTIAKDQDAIDYIYNTANSYSCRILESIDDVIKRLKQFRANPQVGVRKGFNKKANDVSKPNGVSSANGVSETVDKGDSEPEPAKEPVRAVVHIFETDKARAIVPRQDVSLGFPPPGEVSALAGKAGVGKTSLIMHYVAEATKKGCRAVVWTFDMAYDFLVQYMLAYGAVNKSILVIDGPTSFEGLNNMIQGFRVLGDKDAPLLFVPDPFVDMFGSCSGEFMFNERNKKEAEFNPNDQLSWVRAFNWLLPWVRKNNLSVLGTCHPAKGSYGHELPHSAKLQGYLHAWHILYRKGMNMRAFPEQWLIEKLEDGKDGTRLLFNGKNRGGKGLDHFTFQYGDEIDKELLNPNVTYVPSAIDNWTELEEDFEKDEFDISTGKGGVKTISESTIIEAILEKAEPIGTYDLRRKLKIDDNDILAQDLLYGQLHRLADEKKLEKKQYGKGCQWKAL